MVTTRKKVLSDGGGLNSHAMLLDAVERGELPDWCVHVNTGAPGDPGEWPGTMKHLMEVTKPLCEKLGVKFHIIEGTEYPVRGARSLFAWLAGDRGPGKPRANVQIPVTGPNRICTIVAKVERFEAWLDDTFPGEEVEVWIGFEAGEEDRAAKDPNAGKVRKPKPGQAIRFNRFPLIEGNICRCRCERIARASGHPVPRKSACTYCPYGSKGDWQTFASELPEDFAKVAELEALKPLTGNGKKLSIMGYKTDKLTASAHRALVTLYADPMAKVHGGVRKALLARELVEAVEGGGPNAGNTGHLLTTAGEKALAGGKGHVLGYKAPPLPEFIEGAYKGGKTPCGVCGAARRATKSTGCGFLEASEFVEDEPDVPVSSLVRAA